MPVGRAVEFAVHIRSAVAILVVAVVFLDTQDIRIFIPEKGEDIFSGRRVVIPGGYIESPYIIGYQLNLMIGFPLLYGQVSIMILLQEPERVQADISRKSPPTQYDGQEGYPEFFSFEKAPSQQKNDVNQ
jgi:hypothetical protein